MNNLKFILIILLFLNPLVFWGQRNKINIAHLGAKGDGKSDNTLIIQKAIDNASASGKGRVIIPAGRFITGVIHLKSNIELHLDENAFLLGSPKRSDYGSKDASPLIVADHQHNISITGKGIIDGQGDQLIKDIYWMLNAGTLEDTEWKVYNPWHQMRPEERNRPKIIELTDCDTLNIKGITIKNGLCWVQNYKNSSNITIDSIKVESNTFWNNDGIDITDCKNVRITNCQINCDDDGICLKSYDPKKRCENIYVANCSVRASASAVKLGTASKGGFKNITIHDITVYDTFRSAIAIESVDGGILEDVEVRNIRAKNTGNAIFIRLGHRNIDSVYSQLRHIHISNIKAEIPLTKPDKGYPMEGPEPDFAHNVFPSSISGIPGHEIEDVTLKNIELIYQGGGKNSIASLPVDSLSKIPEQISEYPEFSMFGELPSWGFYARHVKGLKLENITIKVKEKDYRPAYVLDDVDRLVMDKIEIQGNDACNQIFLNNISKTELNIWK